MSLPLLEAAQGQPMDRSDVQAQTVISSTHQYPDGTMTTLLQRAASQGWPLYTWCWQETLEPHGWLRQAQVDRKRGEISGQMWSIEFDLQEPTAQGRAIDPDAVEWTFDASLGNSNAATLEHGWEAASGEPGEQPRPGRYAHGADWAQAVDYTVVATLQCDVTPLQLVSAVRTPPAPLARHDRLAESCRGTLPGACRPRCHRRRIRGRRASDGA